MAEDLHIRDYAPGRDDAALRALGNEVFGLRRDADFWRWKYLGNPAGPAQISLAEHAGAPVCMAAALPVRVRVGGRAALGSLSVDVATREDFRGRGIYRRVAGHLYDRLREKGFALTFGFTNRFSTRVTLEVLGRQEVGSLPLRIRPLRPLRWLASRALRLGPAEPPSLQEPDSRGVRRVDRFDARWDELWGRLEAHVDIATVRDGRYLDWRYACHPERPYEILAAEEGSGLAGYVVTRMLDRFGTRAAFVADLGEDPRFAGTARRLLRVAATRARHRGATVLALLSGSASPVHAAARTVAPLPVPRRLFPQENVFSVISHEPTVPTEALAKPGRWWISWGDTDVV